MDIDTLDPAFAPATGTPETGGWSTRELRTILRGKSPARPFRTRRKVREQPLILFTTKGLKGIQLVAADIVEVAPAYDTNAELTTMAAADALFEVMTLMTMEGPLSSKS